MTSLGRSGDASLLKRPSLNPSITFDQSPNFSFLEWLLSDENQSKPFFSRGSGWDFILRQLHSCLLMTIEELGCQWYIYPCAPWSFSSIQYCWSWYPSELAPWVGNGTSFYNDSLLFSGTCRHCSLDPSLVECYRILLFPFLSNMYNT